MSDIFDDLPPYDRCQKCDKVVRIGLRKNIISNGAIAVWIACLESDPIHRLRSDGTNVSKAQVEKWGFTLESIPTVNDYSYVGCAVEGCTQVGVENNHWAPKEIWGKRESDKWPQSRLCKPHHDEWHRKMRDYGWKATTKVPDIKGDLNGMD